MDKTSENGWMESIVPPFSPLDVDDANSAIAEADRKYCPALAFKVGLCPFSFCVTSSKMSFSFTWEVAVCHSPLFISF
jgi:hypothetical protein